ncbi:MAG: hypothetical protein KIT22_00110 [Verrucomicrobiae bacterium]|nr:hypothetical protein [Verrucomicrobiae bacterium]
MGTIFRSAIAGTIAQVRASSLAEEFGEHQVTLWRNADDTIVAGPIAVTFKATSEA